MTPEEKKQDETAAKYVAIISGCIFTVMVVLICRACCFGDDKDDDYHNGH
jgi:hypothetical protein